MMGIFVAMDTCCTIQIDAIVASRILLVHLTCVAIWGQSVLIWDYLTIKDKNLIKIVNFINFAYHNDIKYIILHDQE